MATDSHADASTAAAALPWPLPGAESLRARLLAAWGEPSRGYHDRRHLAEVLERLEELARAGVDFDPLPVTLAAWFHDAVYDGGPDAEERSARWAEADLPLCGVSPAEVVEVARLVRLTQHHDPRAEDRNGAALVDADLAILASDPERYAGYLAGVRWEYRHFSDEDFAAGRADVVRRLLAAPRLFRTSVGRTRWEAAARANLSREVQ